MSRCFTWVSIWFRRTQFITSIGLFYKKCGKFTRRVSDCEELSGGLLRGDDGDGFSGGYCCTPFTCFPKMSPLLS